MLIILNKSTYDKKNEAGEVTGQGFQVITGAGSHRVDEETYKGAQAGMFGCLVSKSINVKGKIVVIQDFVLYSKDLLNALTK